MDGKLTPALLECLRIHSESVDTGEGNNENSRALIVYNLSASDQCGYAKFRGRITLGINETLPAILVTRHSQAHMSEPCDVETAPDRKARPDKVSVYFSLNLDVGVVAGHGYKVFIASVMDRATNPNDTSPDNHETSPNEMLLVIETTLHPGRLPETGTFVPI